MKLIERMIDRINAKPDVFNMPPKILITDVSKLIVIWSAKSGSVYASKWFYYQNHMLKKAMQKSRWIHDFRLEYQKSENYRKAINAFIKEPEAFNVIKLVRNPYTRAVSSFLHMLKFIHFEKKYALDFISNDGKVKVNKQYSFKEYLEILKQKNIYAVNMHWSSQIHALELNNIVKPKIVKLENSQKEIEAIEAELKLKKSNFEFLTRSNHHIKSKPNLIKDDFANEQLDWSNADNLPDYKSFYNEETKKLVAEIYQKDFELYNYGL